MFCTNCGNKVNDEALFCIHCGTKIKRQEDVKSAEQVQPLINMQQNTQPVINMQQNTQPLINMQQNTQPVKEVLPEKLQERTRIIPLTIISILFSILAIAAAVSEMIDGSGEISDIAKLIIISVTSAVLIVSAVSDSRFISVLKGNMLTIFLIADIVFVGFSSVKYAIETMGTDASKLAKSFDVSEGLIMAYLVSVIVWIVGMYIFFIIDMIRAYIGTGKIKILTLFFGCVAALGVIMQMILMAVVQGSITVYFGFIPINTVYACMILGAVFGVASKKTKKSSDMA